ncbi:MAG: PAS domain S-box protein, partial [Candidatus Thermoplasmatota archaeon]|nr:PAS domain S-box protein [Candidatus Thermoplasmatota archaeon]
MEKTKAKNNKDNGLVKTSVEPSLIIIMIIEKDEIIRTISSSVFQELGYQPNDLIGRSLKDFIYPDDLKKTMEFLRKDIGKHKRQTVHAFQMKHANGSLIDVELTIYRGLLESDRNQVIGILNPFSKFKAIEQELHKSQQKNRALLKALPDLLFIITKDGVYEEFYAFDPDALALKPEEIIGSTLEKTGFSQEDIKKIRHIISQSLHNHSIETFEYSLPVKGKQLIFETRIAPFDTNKVLALARDVTKQKQTENVLMESERLFKEIFEYAPIGIYRTTSEGKILLSNATLWNMLGYSSFKELAERDLEKNGYHPSYNRESFKKNIAAQGRITGLEATWKKKDGSLIYLRENAHAIYDKEGRIICYEGTVEDITEKKEIEERLRQSQEQYRLLVEHQQDFIITLDSRGYVNYASPSFSKLLSRSDTELINTKLHVYVHREDQKKLSSVLRSIRALDETFYLELRMIYKSGWCWIAWKFNPTRNKENGSMQIIAAGRDITDQKKAEIQLSETKDHLQNIIDNSKDIIITFDMDGRISTWNRSVEKITGFEQSTVLHKKPTKSSLFKNPESLESMITNAFKRKQGADDVELMVNTKEGDTIVFNCSTSPILDENNQMIGLLILGSLVTKEILQPIKKGRAYLFTDEKQIEMYRRFEFLIEKGYDGLVITRGSNENMKRLPYSQGIMVKVFGIEKNNTYQIISSPKELIDVIKGFLKDTKKSIILVDRLDFLLIRYPFEMVMESIYMMHSLVVSNDSILFLHINTTVFNLHQI